MTRKINGRYKQILMGIVLVGIGVGYLGEQMGYWNFTIFFPGWWTLFLIVPALYGMLEYGISFFNIWPLLLGGYFLVSANGWIQGFITLPILMAITCICIGIRLLFKRKVKWYGYKADGYND